MSKTETQDGDEENENELRFEIPAERFRQFIDPMDSLVSEAKLRFDAGGISAKAVDPANVAMIDASLDASAFDLFEATEGAIGIVVGDVADLLEAATEDAVVRFETVPHQKYTITVGPFKWTEGWITPDHIRREPDLPELDLPAEIVFSADHLKRIVEYATFVKRGGYVFLSVDEAERAFVAEAMDDTDTGEYRLTEEDGIAFNNIGPARSRYSNDYLRDCAAGLPDGAEVTLELGEEYPFKLHFGIDGGRVTYMQAPRIVTD